MDDSNWGEDLLKDDEISEVTGGGDYPPPRLCLDFFNGELNEFGYREPIHVFC